MLPYVFGLTALSGMRPYFRKHVLNALEVHDFVLINSLIIFAFFVLYFLFVCTFKNYSLKKTYENCCRLSFTQVLGVVLLGVSTVISSILILNLDKYFNTPSMNYILLKAFSMVALFLVGVFLFEEVYSLSHCAGIGFIVVGILLIMLNTTTTTK